MFMETRFYAKFFLEKREKLLTMLQKKSLKLNGLEFYPTPCKKSKLEGILQLKKEKINKRI